MTTTIPVSWEVDVTSGAPVSIVSNGGKFVTPSGSSLGIGAPTVLSTTATIRTRLSESLSVPNSVVISALRRGLKQFRYQRIFLIDGTEYEAFLTLDIKGMLTKVDANPAQLQVATGRSANITVRWTGQLAGTIGGAITVSSSGGSFTTSSGMRLGSFSRNLSRPVTGSSVSFNETIQVPRDVIYRAQKLGNARFLLTRDFTDGFTTATGTVALNITGGSGGVFTINRIDLMFPDRQRLRVVDRGERVKVIADITYGGSGLLSANWEIATTATSGGALIFQSLRLVRKYLSGFGRVELESPQLPVPTAGQYVVRLRINSPALQGDIPYIRYFVTERHPRTQKKVRILAPAENVLLAAGVRFAWAPVPGAAYIQIEVYPKQSAKPGSDKLVAGLAVPASQREVAFTRLAQDRLVPGRDYRWRTIAINKAGEVVATSGFRKIKTP
ncbi:MAG TPA: hypothetical protein ENI80_01155 [Acidiferrobacteraceae bacterium]|nr:hypothetical protein [Acidiferrobacteraceae bacterium]